MDMQQKFSVKKDDLTALMKLELTGTQVKATVDEKYGGVPELCEKLSSNPSSGIADDPAQIRSRQEIFGPNTLPQKKSKSFLQLAFKAAKEPMLIILQIAALVSLALSIYAVFGPKEAAKEVGTGESNSTANGNNTAIFNTTITSVITSTLRDKGTRSSTKDEGAQYEWIEGVAILAAVVIITLVSAINDYGKEKQFRALQNQVRKEHQVLVVRGGQQKQVATDDLVVGDICILKYGDVAPTDGLVLAGQDLRMDESSLTGESDHVTKRADGDIRILSGTNVVEGTGKMLVTAVGLNSQSGIVFGLLLGATSEEKKKAKKEAKKKKKESAAGAKETQAKKEDDDEDDFGADTGDGDQSVLQKKLTIIAFNIGKVGVLFAVATALIIIIEFCVQTYTGSNGRGWSDPDLFKILDGIIIGITILVVAIPEGLPLAVTLTLAVSGKKMMKDHNLVRHLYACETMGCATTICSDKTGTLTTNRMTVGKTYIGGKICTPRPPPSDATDKLMQLTAEAVSVNSNYATDTKPNPAGGPPLQIGNKTECALLQFVNEAKFDYKEIRKKHPEDSFAKVYTFNSARKSMTTVISTDRGWRVLSKGGAEMIIARCDYILNANGKAEEFSEEQKNDVLDTVVSQMAAEGLRTICVAYKDIPSSPDSPDFNDENAVTSGLTCLAIFGIEDPVRQEVPSAIKQCAKAGVTVRMVTGDNVNTAKSIALKCGIITSNDEAHQGAVLESDEFNKRIRDKDGKVDQRLFDKVWPKLRVLARSTPQDKFHLVAGIIASRATKHRQVVAVTGDGTNDAPALKKADVGFAMGIAGTDVAKEASDIILTDDNFISIVKACMWGRNIYDNICKFLQFQLTVNFSALILSVVGAAYLGNTPLKAVPMLWLNLIQDTLASLALSTEPPSEHLLDRKPYGRKSRILSATMIRNIVGQGCYQLLVMFLLVFGRDKGLFDFLHPEGNLNETQADTMVFNIFVYMTIFNLINSRCVHDERNVFARFFRNPIFLVIILLMAGTQAIVVQFGGLAFKSEPLNWQEWVACIIMGLLGLVWYQVIVFIPAKEIFTRLKRIKPTVKRDFTLSHV